MKHHIDENGNTALLYTMGRDLNGNKVLKIKPTKGRGFSIQTNGNLRETDRNGVGEHTREEAMTYVLSYGTPRQKSFFN